MQSTEMKAFVLDALDTLFNRRDYEAAARAWSPDYIQHAAFVPPGRDALFALVRKLPEGSRYEAGLAVIEGEHVMIHGRYTMPGRPVMISVDIFRIEDGQLAEHWDVLQKEVDPMKSASGMRMFG